MKRLAFYKEYYELTNRIYADRTIWSAKGREHAWRKGKILTSKTERRILVAAQYFALLITGISFAAGNNRFGMLGCILFLKSKTRLRKKWSTAIVIFLLILIPILTMLTVELLASVFTIDITVYR